MLRNLIASIFCLLALGAHAQESILQGGPFTPGHSPMYVGQGSVQAVVQDSGPAGGGGVGIGLSEQLLVARGTGNPPYAGQGTGPLGTNWCDYDAPLTSAYGYHYLCMSANADGGGLIAYGAAGGATNLPLQFMINGGIFTPGGSNLVIGSTLVSSSTVGDGLYIGTGNLLEQFSYGSNVFGALESALNGSGGLVGYSGALGTPTQANLANAIGLPISTGINGNAPNGGGTFATRSIAEIINPGTARYDQGLIINTQYIDSNNAAIMVTSPNQNGRALSIDGPQGAPNSIVASISGTNLALVSGTLTQGQYLTDAGSTILPGTYIVSGSGSNWIVSRSQTVAQETMSAWTYDHYTHIDTNGSIWSLSFWILSGNLSSNGTILGPSTDASMFAIWPDVPLAIQARSNGYARYLSLLSATGKYTSTIDFNGTLWWGSQTNTSINTMDSAIGRGNGPGAVNIGGPDTGAPVAETLTVSSAAAPIVVDPNIIGGYFYGDVLEFTSGTFPSGWHVGDTVNDLTVPSGISGGATIASIDAGAYTVTLNSYVNPYGGDVISNGTTTAVLYALPTPYLCYGNIPAGIAVNQVVTDQTNPSGIVATTTVAALYPSIPAQGNQCVQLSQNANTHVANYGGSLDTFVFSTPNTAAAALTIAGGSGTGTGNGGPINIATAPAGSSGSAQNPPVNNIVIDPSLPTPISMKNNIGVQAIIAQGTKPTAAGSGGTCATGAVAGGAIGGTVTLTGACAATNTIALSGLPAVPTGYICHASDRTTPAIQLVENATTTTSVTFDVLGTTGGTDVIQFDCPIAY
jgi:hypothetical protein